jgi:hypothetical protein
MFKPMAACQQGTMLTTSNVLPDNGNALNLYHKQST